MADNHVRWTQRCYPAVPVRWVRFINIGEYGQDQDAGDEHDANVMKHDRMADQLIQLLTHFGNALGRLNGSAQQRVRVAAARILRL